MNPDQSLPFVMLMCFTISPDVIPQLYGRGTEPQTLTVFYFNLLFLYRRCGLVNVVYSS